MDSNGPTQLARSDKLGLDWTLRDPFAPVVCPAIFLCKLWPTKEHPIHLQDKKTNIKSNEDVEHIDNDRNIEGTKITASTCEGKINKDRNEAMKSDKKEEKESTNHNQENNQKQMVIEGQEFETTQNKETQRI